MRLMHLTRKEERNDMSELDIIMFVIGLILGMFVMSFIYGNRDKELSDKVENLEKELTIKQNVIESNNETIGRLRKICKRKGYETDDSNN